MRTEKVVEEEGGLMAVASLCESNSLTQREGEREADVY